VLGVVQQVLPLISGLVSTAGGGGGQGGQTGFQLGGNTLRNQNQSQPNFANLNQGRGFQPVGYTSSTAGTSATPTTLGGATTATGGARTTARP